MGAGGSGSRVWGELSAQKRGLQAFLNGVYPILAWSRPGHALIAQACAPRFAQDKHSAGQDQTTPSPLDEA
jgi:hypothetical protein